VISERDAGRAKRRVREREWEVEAEKDGGEEALAMEVV
jgi:hypothetical protein